MGVSMMMRRAAGTLLVSGVVAGGLAVVGAPPAAAGRTPTTIARASWAHTDSLAAGVRSVNGSGDAPVGAWRDDAGKHHMAKSYFTFDLSVLRGARIFSAEAAAAERSANDCAKPRAIQLWLTDTAEQPTWSDQPEERAMLPGPTAPTGCLSNQVGWDATESVRQAVAAGTSKITLALRVSEDEQGDVRYGRTYANDLRINIMYNQPPNLPAQLVVDGQPCARTAVSPRNLNPTLSAQLTDPNPSDSLSGHFAVWPVGQPDQRTEFTSPQGANGMVAMVGLTDAVLVDGRTYEWAVRADDGDDLSGWSAPCQYTVDHTPPNVEPTVMSADYPADGAWHGGAGIPGSFTFTANGVPDVAGFYYGDSDPPSTFVAADHPGGSATVSYTPQRSGPNDLYVVSVDRAGNRSPKHIHHFYARSTEPGVKGPQETGLGVPAEFTFSPGMPDVVSYTYQVNGGPEVTVPAVADGTGTASITTTKLGHNNLTVWSTTSTGLRSGIGSRSYTANDAPLVASDVYPEYGTGGGPGVPGTFTLTPRMPNVVEYTCYFNWDSDNPTVVTAGPDGRATFTFTPTEPGFHIVEVHAQAADGSWSSNYREYYFDVSPAP
jgi:hypothetical protein